MSSVFADLYETFFVLSGIGTMFADAMKPLIDIADGASTLLGLIA